MENIKKAYIAGGCFWLMEDLFRVCPRVVNTEVGYLGGVNDNPTYPNHPGHAEGSKLLIIPARHRLKSYWIIFSVWMIPPTMDRQGNDRGSSYRSAVFI